MKKKIILLFGLLLILSGCKNEEIKESECTTKKEKEVIVEYQDNYVMLIVNGKEQTAKDITEIYSKNNYQILFNTIKSDLLEKEMSAEIKAAEEYVAETIKTYESYYGTLTEHYLVEYGNCNTLEECKEIIKTNYLEEKYIKNYTKIHQKDLKISTNISKEDLETYYFYYFYVDAITTLFNKYQVTIVDSKLNKIHNEYLNELKSNYQEQIYIMEHPEE